MAVKTKEVFDEFNPQLVRSLPLKDPYFIAELTKQHLFSGVLKEEVITASTEAEATTRFLYKAVERSLDIDDREPFDRLVLVMEKFGNLTLNKLAEEIKDRLNPKATPKPEPISKAIPKPEPTPNPALNPNPKPIRPNPQNDDSEKLQGKSKKSENQTHQSSQEQENQETGWNKYIEQLIIQTKDANGVPHCDKACIIGLEGVHWTTNDHPNAIKLQNQEAVDIAKCFKTKDFTRFKSNMVQLEGISYTFVRKLDDKTVFVKRKGSGGYTLQASKFSVVIGHCPEGGQQENTNEGVSIIAEYLESLGM